MSYSKQNILLFHVDQLRADVCGAYGSRLGLTPHLDHFAKSGLVLMNHYAVNPVCTPNRAALFTGQYSTANGVWRNGMGLRPDQRTLVDDLSAAGYETAYIGKWHLAGHHSELPDGHSYADFAEWCEQHPDHNGPVPDAFRGGFRYWLGAETPDLFDDPWDTVLWDENDQPHRFPGHRIDAYTDCAIRYLTQNRDKPFCLTLSYLEPHHQNHEEWYAAVPALEEVCRDLPLPGDLAALQHLRPEVREKFAGYCANVRKLDEAFGRLLDVLKSLGLEENTLVIFTTDHGDHFKTRVDNDDNKRTCHDSVTRIPCLLRGRPFRGGMQVREFTSTVDLFPTLLDLGGIPIPESVQGRSLKELAGNLSVKDRDAAFMQIWGTHGPERALRTAQYKICVRMPNADWWYDFQGSEYRVAKLYDLRSDPDELTNLADVPRYQAVKNRMMKKLSQAMESVGETGFMITEVD